MHPTPPHPGTTSGTTPRPDTPGTTPRPTAPAPTPGRTPAPLHHLTPADSLQPGHPSRAKCSDDEPTAAPLIDPTVNPVTNPIVAPITDPTPDPMTDQAVGRRTDPTVDPTTDPTINLTADPTINHTADPTMDPTADPSESPTADFRYPLRGRDNHKNPERPGLLSPVPLEPSKPRSSHKKTGDCPMYTVNIRTPRQAKINCLISFTYEKPGSCQDSRVRTKSWHLSGSDNPVRA